MGFNEVANLTNNSMSTTDVYWASTMRRACWLANMCHMVFSEAIQVLTNKTVMSVKRHKLISDFWFPLAVVFLVAINVWNAKDKSGLLQTLPYDNLKSQLKDVLFKYDPQDQLTEVSDPRRLKTSYGHSGFNELTDPIGPVGLESKCGPCAGFTPNQKQNYGPSANSGNPFADILVFFFH